LRQWAASLQVSTEIHDAKRDRDAAATQESMLGSPDPSSLTDYVRAYNVIRDIKVFPINKQLVLQVAAQAGTPLLFVWIVATPVEQIIVGLLKRLV
jgi:hypothetical protein